VVDDNLLVAEAIRDLLVRSGWEVVGPAATLEAGLALAERGGLDGALLDVNLAGHFSFPIARALSAREVPFAFLTGYDDLSIIPPEFHGAPRLSKPFNDAELAALIAASFGGEAASRAPKC
jgi:DNA-binding response OmpR family regulator